MRRNAGSVLRLSLRRASFWMAGRGNRYESEDHLRKALAEDGVIHDASDMPEALSPLLASSRPGRPGCLSTNGPTEPPFCDHPK
jgi:hypothetical protein